MLCKICLSQTRHFSQTHILGKYDAELRQCTYCGYLYLADPHWLKEAYTQVITALDTGIVERNLWLADATTVLLRLTLGKVARALDYGGGSGLYTRLMRDRGFDFYWSDRYCPNLLAGGFEATEDEPFDLICLFELLEHLEDPMIVLRQLTQRAPMLLISTDLLPDPVPAPGSWSYYAEQTGQHIGFFSRKSLHCAAEQLDLQLSSNDRNLHILGPARVSERLLRWLRKPKHARWPGRWLGGRSLAHRDSALLASRLQALASKKE